MLLSQNTHAPGIDASAWRLCYRCSLQDRNRSTAASGKVGKPGTVVGIDLSAGMIEFAQRLSPVTGAAAEWRQGDLVALPVPGISFDMAFCQQGLQFFPD